MPDIGAEARGSGGRSLRHVQAAQLRARALRWAIGKSTLGTLFLLGALAYALGPDRQDPAHQAWAAFLIVLSTFNVGLGLRALARVRAKRRRPASRYWLVVTLAWGGLATALLKILFGWQ
jgi:hypothetical protein